MIKCFFIKRLPINRSEERQRSTLLLPPPKPSHPPTQRFVSINGMELRHPYDAYTQLWSGITGSTRRTPGAAASELERYFSSGRKEGRKRETTLLLLDEVSLEEERGDS